MKVKLYKDTKRYTGSYVTIGGMSEDENTIIVEVPSLPPTEDINKQKFHRWDTHEVQTGTKQVPIMVQERDVNGELVWEDSESTIPKMVQDTDEEGNPIFTEEPIIESITEWIFNEDGYNKWKEEQEAIVPEPTSEEKINALSETIMDLTDVIISLMI